MKLPCRHILYSESMFGLPLFDASCCAAKGTVSYYQANQRLFMPRWAEPRGIQ